MWWSVWGGILPLQNRTVFAESNCNSNCHHGGTEGTEGSVHASATPPNNKIDLLVNGKHTSGICQNNLSVLSALNALSVSSPNCSCHHGGTEDTEGSKRLPTASFQLGSLCW
jgi:hypothetical protein